MDNLKRRAFVQQMVMGGASLSVMPYSSILNPLLKSKLSYKLEHIIPTKLYDGEKCWVHPRAGLAPGYGVNGQSRVVMTMNTLDLIGSDVFKGMHGLQTDDLGKTWSAVEQFSSLAPRTEVIEGVERPVAASDFWPKYHKKTKTLLGIGHTVVYTPEWKVKMPRPRHTSYAVYNPETSQWDDWRKLKMPDSPKFYNAGAGSTQRYDEKDGTILLPISYYPPGKNSHISMIRCQFDGQELSFLEQGNVLHIDNDTRGLHEASVTKFQGWYYMTLRNDKLGFVTRSKDGMNFEPIRPWTFDDGQELGNYNTQQNWVTHSKALFLVYTRRGANNDHVFRHRAPLFMAQVNPKTMQVIRATEQIIVPEKGARLGNFGVTDISENETWVTVSEWMQPHGVDKYGSDGSVWIARLLWNQKNKYFTI